jgi:hypothetical protein
MSKIICAVALLSLSLTPACKESKADNKEKESTEKSSAKKESTDEEAPKAKKPATASVTIASIKPSLVDDYEGKGKYVKVAFEVTPQAKLEASKDLRVKMLCQVGDKKLTEKPSALINFAEIGKGETKKTDVAAWVLDPLAKAPTACTLTFLFGDIIGDDDEKVTEVCFKPPSKITDGACE